MDVCNKNKSIDISTVVRLHRPCKNCVMLLKISVLTFC